MNAITEIYDGNDLGCHYTKKECHFKIWAPTAERVLLALYHDAGTYNQQGEVKDHGGGLEIVMKRGNSGVWFLDFSGDLVGQYYMYRIEHVDGFVRYVVDPYARAVSANGARTAIVDLEACCPLGWEQDKKPPLLSTADAVLYELHVRDFSISPDSGIHDKGKFMAFTETGLRDEYGNALGIDHLAELGITHVHLLPVFDFKTVNELKSNSAFSRDSEYNWGYDPQHFNVPEGSYSTDARKPDVRIREFKEMVMALHRKGIRVVMDVVYNHTFSVLDGPFESIVPGYFYRTDYSGKLSNGSGVGNELATERPMVRKYIIDSVRYWAEEYHIDGFRFDLVGLIDTETIAQLTAQLHQEIDENLIVYGEPWTGGDTPLWDKTLKGTQKGKGFAVFNDNFRGAIKGDSDGWGRGFVTGEMGKEAAIVTGVQGSVYDFTDSPLETINYVTVHDNLNLWDKVLTTEGLREQAGFPDLRNGSVIGGGTVEEALKGADPYRSVSQSDVMASDAVKRSLLANGIVLTSQGIPMIQAGDELLRSKFGDHNSYRSGDAINAIRWHNKHKFRQVFDYYRGLISLRRNHPAFRMNNREQIERHLQIMHCKDNLIAFQLKGHANGDPWKNIMVIYNANRYEAEVELPQAPKGWKVAVDDCNAGTKALDLIAEDTVIVPRLSMMVLYEDERGKPRPVKTVEIHYDRPNGDYEGWNLWVWGTGVREQRVNIDRIEQGRAVFKIVVGEGVHRIGYIVRLNQWEAKDVDGDRFVELAKDQKNVIVMIRSGVEGWKMIS